jgi:hypothetical protein
MTDPFHLAQRLWKHIELPKLVQDTISVASALLTGQDVSLERLEARLKICAACPEVKRDGDKLKCGICGCKVVGTKQLINLARFEETDKYGCKHKEGSQWKKGGV